MSEIDEIFATKGKTLVLQSDGRTELTKKKNKKKKRKRDTQPTDTSARPPAEIVLDPSASLPAGKRVKHSIKSSGPKVSVKEPDLGNSRGTQSRRKTEEGWNIYKEDELGIRDEGVDTPLCPFDCDCCF